MSGRYNDIIKLPHHVSSKHPQMSRQSRAAQFAPFAALTGLDDEMDETARLTDRKIELDDSVKEEISRVLYHILNNPQSEHSAIITYFVSDGRKDGGAYITSSINIKKIDEYRRVLIASDRKEIPFDDIFSLKIKK